MRDKRIWVFNSGDKFVGNPKYMFLYVNQYRKDITPYWFTTNKKVVEKIKKLGYKAYLYNTPKGDAIQKKAGVFVCNQVKEIYPKHLLGATMLNLWHGVGCKNIERKLNSGVLLPRVAKKYIRYNYQYTNNQLFLVTSKLMEDHFKEQVGLNSDKIIKGGYPCCSQKSKIKTFDHNILAKKRLSEDTKIVMYAPTFRENNLNDFLEVLFLIWKNY